jgi:hypothetical protein
MPTPSSRRALATALTAIVAIGLTSPAMAAAEPTTRVVGCRAGSCLLISGHRANAGAVVSINGHVVPVEGKRDWQVRLPVETVRDWSIPLARTISVTLSDAGTGGEIVAEADLPIGLLGHPENLASLVISIK